ncbi:MAG: cysteine desulfurase [Deltaproteobacteria bacterium]|nr:cysteine desulfurase [Deltaproteobacteria bacterium]MBW2393932.1 cysteine desulfurase [Deltaproteobacteria bacterium]
MSFDPYAIRNDFPILERTNRGKPLVYLDTAASAQKPRAVIDAISEFYESHYANIHRGVYELSERATRMHDDAREKVAAFLGAAESREIVFTRNATESINLVAASWGRQNLGAGDEILITTLEHHANIVPWQLLCEEKNAHLRVVPINDAGELDMDAFESLLSDRTRLVAASHVSNALGTINPVREIISIAHERGIPVLLDGAQAVPRFAVDVQELGCDFYVFSGHKLYGPSGVGILYGRAELLESMPVYQSGGDMIETVSFEKSTFKSAPYKFEAGTPDIAGAIGLGAAIQYLSGLGMDEIERHEMELTAYGTKLLEAIPEVRLIGTAAKKTGVLSFVVDGIHPHDLGTILDMEGIAIRAGHHCAQPLMERFDVPATARASLGLYNIPEDLDHLGEGLHKAIEMFR